MSFFTAFVRQGVRTIGTQLVQNAFTGELGGRKVVPQVRALHLDAAGSHEVTQPQKDDVYTFLKTASITQAAQAAKKLGEEGYRIDKSVIGDFLTKKWKSADLVEYFSQRERDESDSVSRDTHGSMKRVFQAM